MDTFIVCQHKDGGRVHLPYEVRGRELGVLLQPYCMHCGAVKNISWDRTKKIGYYINILSELSRIYKISDAQIRLIVNELNKIQDFEDGYCMTGSAQEFHFIRIVRNYSAIPENAIKSLL